MPTGPIILEILVVASLDQTEPNGAMACLVGYQPGDLICVQSQEIAQTLITGGIAKSWTQEGLGSPAVPAPASA